MDTFARVAKDPPDDLIESQTVAQDEADGPGGELLPAAEQGQQGRDGCDGRQHGEVQCAE